MIQESYFLDIALSYSAYISYTIVYYFAISRLVFFSAMAIITPRGAAGQARNGLSSTRPVLAQSLIRAAAPAHRRAG
jgi:hypothetical protein